jgi:hypothetical protein
MAANTTGPSPVPKDTIDEKLAAFDNVPLFMKSLPEDASDDPTMMALQSLAHEGTPEGMSTFLNFLNRIFSGLQMKEVASNFKDQGNEYFKGKRFREALGFYTQGIDAKPDDPPLLEALLSNRAACNLELSK